MTLEPLQRRDLTLLATLRAVSFLGDFAALTALFLRLAPAHHPWAIAALAIAGSLPLVLLAPVAGHVVDRFAAKRLLVLFGFGEALVCVGLGHWHGLVATLVLMAVLNSMVAFSLPGYTALVPSAVGEANVGQAQGMLQAAQALASVAGPVLGGLLVGSTGQSWPLYVDAISFLLAALATTALRHDRRPSARTTLGEIEAEHEGMMAGVAFIFRDGLLRVVEVSVSVFMLSLGMINVAEVFFVTQTLHGTATDYGLIGACFGVGTVIGALSASKLSQEVARLARTAIVAIIVIGASIASMGLMTRVIWLYPPLVVAGVAVGLANVAVLTLFTVRTPERLRGRVFAAVGGVITACEIAATALGGVVLTVITPRTVFLVAGSAATLVAAVLGPMGLRFAAERRPGALGDVAP